LAVKSRYGYSNVREIKYTLHSSAVTKQRTAKWPYIANAVFRIVQNHGGKSYFVGFRGGDRPKRSPWIRPWNLQPYESGAWPPGCYRLDTKYRL